VVVRSLSEQIDPQEKAMLAQARNHPEYRHLLTAPGIGKVLALTILLETGDIGRFPGPGHYAPYCRCVGSARISKGKGKGNKYLAWAFVNAANFSTRYNDRIKAYYQRKLHNTHPVVARKTVAHKIALACKPLNISI